jgi:hypothetical protein
MDLNRDMKFLNAAKSILRRAEICGNTTAKEALRVIEVELPDLLSQGGGGAAAFTFTFFHKKSFALPSCVTIELAKGDLRGIYGQASGLTGDRQQENLCVSAACAYATLVATQLRQVLVATP